ncbi:hypothetical protein SISSUDRAFT_1045329 [Sistotremastrum suecicum HHB10207 ss-3]|uniref:Uncharacterized protein n=1 Tax=Sistotremastrum suecicum HHB10207 ss-3 TaxID=1314776 RepID=A0A166EIQ9_9AGAM|nr:hypothetical protein SISSUDRAFT_1045329 [Sistotremastrum suecicum HHB10207 ss-3]
MASRDLPWQFLSVTQEPSPTEFAQHPDFRPTSCFFLGWVFYASLIHLYRSALVSSIVARVSSLISRNVEDVRQVTINATGVLYWQEKARPWDSESLSGTPRTGIWNADLPLFITASILLAVLSQFLTLLPYNSTNGTTACSLFTAAVIVAYQAGRLVGSFKLGTDLRELGVSQLETRLFWVWSFFTILFILAAVVLDAGYLQDITQLPGFSFCHRNRSLVVALLSGIINLSADLYCLARLLTLTTPAFLKTRHMSQGFFDHRLIQASSLLIFDIIWTIDLSRALSSVAENVPWSLAALVVLECFNYRPTPIPDGRTASMLVTERDRTATRSNSDLRNSSLQLPNPHRSRRSREPNSLLPTGSEQVAASSRRSAYSRDPSLPTSGVEPNPTAPRRSSTGPQDSSFGALSPSGRVGSGLTPEQAASRSSYPGTEKTIPAMATSAMPVSPSNEWRETSNYTSVGPDRMKESVYLSPEAGTFSSPSGDLSNIRRYDDRQGAIVFDIASPTSPSRLTPRLDEPDFRASEMTLDGRMREPEMPEEVYVGAEDAALEMDPPSRFSVSTFGDEPIITSPEVTQGTRPLSLPSRRSEGGTPKVTSPLASANFESSFPGVSHPSSTLPSSRIRGPRPKVPLNLTAPREGMI